MSTGLVHRGPDGAGEFHQPHIGLGMRRLSIIDLEGGWQPLYNEDRSLALIANGEIYNFVELRVKLEGRGHRFSTHSDCETILHLYEDYGLDFVQHLRGMFAVALWDTPRQRLVLARDRMGEKPTLPVRTTRFPAVCIRDEGAAAVADRAVRLGPGLNQSVLPLSVRSRNPIRRSVACESCPQVTS